MSEWIRKPVRHLRKGERIYAFGHRGRVMRLYRKRDGETIVTMRTGTDDVFRFSRSRGNSVMVRREE